MQGYSDYEILETHTDIMEVSRREIELQKQYGYKVDNVYYKESNKNLQYARAKVDPNHMQNLGKIHGPIQGKLNVETGHLKSVCSMGGKVGGKLPSYHIRKLNLEDAQMIRELYLKKTHSQNKLAEMYGVARTAIRQILNNQTYINQ